MTTEVDKLAATVRETLDYMERITLALGPGSRTALLEDAREALDRLAATAREAEQELATTRACLVGSQTALTSEHERAVAAEADRDRLAGRVEQLETALREIDVATNSSAVSRIARAALLDTRDVLADLALIEGRG